MEDLYKLLPTEKMNFFEIKNKDKCIAVNWSKEIFKDYWFLSNQFYECGFKVFEDVINCESEYEKLDAWFLSGIFLLRHSIELSLKALLCRAYNNKKNELQKIFKECKHNLLMMFEKYLDYENNSYLEQNEKQWLHEYLDSIGDIDNNSDMFRFPFDDNFLSKYENTFLDIVGVVNNLLQAFMLIRKCIHKGKSDFEGFNSSFKPNLFIFTQDGFNNCWIRQKKSSESFHLKYTGFLESIDFIYNNELISDEFKFYPIMFMLRNTIELSLKRLFSIEIDGGVDLKKFKTKKRSHIIGKDLWKNVEMMINEYANILSQDMSIIDIAKERIYEINSIDKNGDMFRYPTSFSFEYRFDNKELDLENIYVYQRQLLNFLEGCNTMLSNIADSQVNDDYENMNWM